MPKTPPTSPPQGSSTRAIGTVAGAVALAIAAVVGAVMLLDPSLLSPLPPQGGPAPSALGAALAILLVAGVILGLAAGALRASRAVRPEPEPDPSPTDLPPVTEAGILALLHLFQREGRLVDFLQEDITSYEDAQVGAAVRAIHSDCRQALREHLDLESVMPRVEGDRVVVESGYDPTSVRLSGNVAGEPPYRGVLRHHGWRVRKTHLAPRPESQSPRVLAPAEVEVE